MDEFAQETDRNLENTEKEIEDEIFNVLWEITGVKEHCTNIVYTWIWNQDALFAVKTKITATGG